MTDTIVALATPPGKSGVAVIRVSGKKSLECVKAMCNIVPTPRYAHYVTIQDAKSRELIDNALMIYFNSPKSFTGEDVVEFQCHGSRVVIEKIMKTLLSFGCRYAYAGEFSRRALENNKLDLIQVEALADLIDAETARQHSQSLMQLSGDVSNRYDALVDAIIDVRAFCEVFLDFPDDDLPQDLDEQINDRIVKCIDIIDSLLSNATIGRSIRDGIKVAIIGTPNVGKSTLINTIADKKVAITSPMAGTTRDAIEVYKDINGIPFKFYDTAGLRESDDEIEQEGVLLSKQFLEDSDYSFIVIDGSLNINDQLSFYNDVSRETILVVNKVDLVEDKKELQDYIDGNVSRETFLISAKNNEGVESLLKFLSDSMSDFSNEDIFVTRQRHHDHLVKASEFLVLAKNIDDIVLKAENLILSTNEIYQILGKISYEDILDRLFSSFCIGK